MQTAFSVIKQFMMDENGENAASKYANDLLGRLKVAGVKVINPDMSISKTVHVVDGFTLSTVVGNQYIHFRYIGYTDSEAHRLFKTHVADILKKG